MSQIQVTFSGEGQICESQLADLKAYDVQILTAKSKHLKSIELICGELNLRWLDLRNNSIDDQQIRHLLKLKHLEVLLLDNNQVKEVDGLISVCKENGRLETMSVCGNPFLFDDEKVKRLLESVKSITIVKNSTDESIIQLRKKCLFLSIKNEQKTYQLIQFKKELFEDKSRAYIDLGRYLINLKIYCSNYGELIHTLVSTLKKLNKQDSRIKETYPNLPWSIIEEWPQGNFIEEYKIDYSKVQTILESESIQYSTSFETELENMLNAFYIRELENLFKKCMLNVTYPNLNKLLEFLLLTCRNYFQRTEHQYSFWINVAFPFPYNIKQDLTKYLLEGGKEKISLLWSILNKTMQTKLTEQEAFLLNNIKKMSFIKVFALTAKQPANRSFIFLILQFFENILSIYCGNEHLITKNKQQNQAFAKFLFVQFNSADVYYLSLLLRQGEMRNEDYFMNNMQKLNNIVSLKKWLDSLEAMQLKLKTVQPNQLNSLLPVFFKKILGRPQFTLSLIKRYFWRFDFEMIQNFVDSYDRPQVIQLLSNKFGSDFSFIHESIIARKSHPNLQAMKILLKNIKLTTVQQSQFIDKTLVAYRFIQKIIRKNPLIQALIDQSSSSFTLLQSILHVIPDSGQVDQIIQCNDSDKLYNLQTRYLLDMMKSIIKVDDKYIQLIDRDHCWFARNLQSMKNAKFYTKHQYIFNFIRFSYKLFLQNLHDSSQRTAHKHLINEEEVAKTRNLKIYLQKINNKYVLSDYLLEVCKQEIRDLVFKVQQGVLTFGMAKFKEFSKDQACKYCFDEDFYQELEMISNTHGLHFLEVPHYQKSKFDDKKIKQALLEAYHQQVLLHCLKKELMNLGQYSALLQKAEDMAKSKGSKLRLPLYQISKMVRTDAFQKSEFKVELNKYLKNKIREQADRKVLLNLFDKLYATLKQQEILDQKRLEFVKEMFIFEQNKLCEVFIKNISLLHTIQFRSKIYSTLNWELLNSFAITNYLPLWEQAIPEIQDRMAKYKRVMCRYLSDPLNFRGQRSTLNHAIDKFQQLILNQQINSMLSQLIILPEPQKKGLTRVLHLIHKCIQLLSQKGKVQNMGGFNYYLCLAVKKKLSHKGFLILTDYLMHGLSSENRQDVEDILDGINYKIQYHQSQNALNKLLIQRQYNPANYSKALMKALTILSNINILNTQIETEFIKNKYPLLPWHFIMMTQTLNPEGMGYHILMLLEEQFGIYLQLLHYLDTRDQTEGILILNKFFEVVYSDRCCNDLIKRINSIFSFDEELKNVIKKLTCFKNYMEKPEALQTKIIQLIDKEVAKDCAPLDRRQLLACLRVLSLKGEYINRIQKTNNKLRNMLCDYDEVGLDIKQFLQSHKDSKSQRILRYSLLQILLMSLKYKDSLFYSNSFNFYLSPIKSSLLDKTNSKLMIEYLNNLNYKKLYANFQQPDLHLKFVILSELGQVSKYFKDVILLYKDLINNLNTPNDSQWQAAEFLHVSIFTIIRLKNKYKMVTQRYPSVETEFIKQPYKVMRNHLAHFIPSDKTLASQKLKVENLEEIIALYRRIDAMIRNVKL